MKALQTLILLTLTLCFLPLAQGGRGAIRSRFPIILEQSKEMQEAGFTTCRQDGGQLPKALIEIPEAIEREEKTLFSAHPKNGSAQLRYVWFVNGPRHLAGDSYHPFVGQTLSFSPQTFGKHQLVLVAQNQEGDCAFLEDSFVASVNRKMPEEVPANDFPLPKMRWPEVIERDAAQKYGLGEGITVAVIGTGIDYLHSELHHSIWKNPDEIPNNGIDDDANGLIDDAYGWDFQESDPHPFDNYFHETGVSGFIAAKRFGIAPKAKIIPLKTGQNSRALDKMPAAIRYAVNEGAHLINISTGFFANDTDVKEEVIANLQKAIDLAEEKGVVIVVSAGNGRQTRAANIDEDPFFPSSFTNKNIVSVAASNWRGEKAGYSNYGQTSVDVVAPGGQLPQGIQMLSPFVPGKEPLMSTQGTSFAAPIVSGAIALALSARPERYFAEDGRIKFDVLHQYLNLSGRASQALSPVARSGRVFSALGLVE